MAVELAPGVFDQIMQMTIAAGNLKSRRAIALMADACMEQAKQNVSTGSHSVNTPTPASEGSGPAIISGTLKASIIRTPVIPAGSGWSAMVGPEPGHYTPYCRPKHHWKPHPKPPADSAKYGYYLETGDWGKTYPWLAPALHMVATVSGPVIMRQVFAAGWPVFG
jgi:hypothetical protein